MSALSDIFSSMRTGQSQHQSQLISECLSHSSIDFEAEVSVEEDYTLATWDGPIPPVLEGTEGGKDALLKQIASGKKEIDPTKNIAYLENKNAIISLDRNVRQIDDNGKAIYVASIRVGFMPSENLFTFAHLDVLVKTPDVKVIACNKWHSKGNEIQLKVNDAKSVEFLAGLNDLISKLNIAVKGKREHSEEYEIRIVEGMQTILVDENGSPKVATSISSTKADHRGLVGGYEMMMVFSDNAIGKTIELELKLEARMPLFRPFVRKWRIGYNNPVKCSVQYGPSP